LKREEKKNERKGEGELMACSFLRHEVVHSSVAYSSRQCVMVKETLTKEVECLPA